MLTARAEDGPDAPITSRALGEPAGPVCPAGFRKTVSLPGPRFGSTFPPAASLLRADSA